MKKVIAIIAIVAGVLTLLSAAVPMIIGIIFETPMSDSVGIIGGADGPTAIIIAETGCTGGIVIAILIGILLILSGIVGFRMIKKNG